LRVTTSGSSSTKVSFIPEKREILATLQIDNKAQLKTIATQLIVEFKTSVVIYVVEPIGTRRATPCPILFLFFSTGKL
jgi:hypothetical protein